jgi:ribosomal-protein-alanine N-acetyltransferase
MNIEYRRAACGDADGVYFVEVSCFKVPWSFDAIRFDLCANPDALYAAAFHNGRVIGFTGMHAVLDEGHIMNMAVLEEYRRRGIGQRLMETLFSLAPEAVRSYTLEVRASNLAAQRLYARLGFCGVGFRRSYYTNPAEDALIMWRMPQGDTASGENAP